MDTSSIADENSRHPAFVFAWNPPAFFLNGNISNHSRKLPDRKSKQYPITKVISIPSKLLPRFSRPYSTISTSSGEIIPSLRSIPAKTFSALKTYATFLLPAALWAENRHKDMPYLLPRWQISLPDMQWFSLQ